MSPCREWRGNSKLGTISLINEYMTPEVCVRDYCLKHFERKVEVGGGG